MLSFMIRRLAAGAVLILALTSAMFMLLYLGSGDIARKLLGETATPDIVAQKEKQLGLDRPVLTQFGDWMLGALRGDLGQSWTSGQPVSAAVGSRLAVTLSLVIGATLVIAVVSVLLGVLAATRGGWIDRAVQVMSVLGFAVPGFLLALGLVLLFAIQLGWFNPTGYQRFTDSPTGWLSSITLPIVALCAGGIAGLTAQVRGAVLDSLNRDYVRTLRSRGIPERRIIYVHVLRNAAGPALSVLGLQFVGLLSGAVFVENIFAIPGIGQSALTAPSQGDIPLVLGVVIVTVVLVVLVNLIADLLQGWLNPKARLT